MAIPVVGSGGYVIEVSVSSAEEPVTFVLLCQARDWSPRIPSAGMPVTPLGGLPLQIGGGWNPVSAASRLGPLAAGEVASATGLVPPRVPGLTLTWDGPFQGSVTVTATRG